MKTEDCEATQERLMLGLDDGVDGHLERCPACGEEAVRVRQLLEQLADSREIEPPRRVDQAVRQAIRSMPRTAPPLRYPYAAIAMAAGSVVMFAVAISSALAPTSLGDAAPAVVLAIVVAYLALSSAASLPLLLRRMSRRALEVKS